MLLVLIAGATSAGLGDPVSAESAPKPDSTALLIAPSAPSEPLPTAVSPAPTNAGAVAVRRPLAAAEVTGLGFENVTLDSADSPLRVGFENRRYRHSVEAYAHLERSYGGPVVAIERRLGLEAAAITLTGSPDQPRFHVRYPTDAGYSPAPPGRWSSPTSRSVDLLLGPLLAYELGRVMQPVQFQFQLAPRIRYNPWPGARATASIVIPVYNDFEPSATRPDVDRVRPGLLTLEQFAWVPRGALCSATVGLLGDNRYGFSIGAARPVWEGSFLIDAQADLTGFIAFSDPGTLYSSMSQWSSFLGLTWRPPFYDVAIRGRIAQFLYGDRGEEIEIKRSLGNVDFALFVLRAGGSRVKGVRITVPVPPMTRGTGSPVRAQPIERFPFSYRTEVETVGLFLTGVASREEFLRQLSGPALNSNLARYHRVKGDPPARRDSGIQDWISLAGTTGFINTPWAGTMKDRSIELGYSHIPKKWTGDAYDKPGKHANERWSLTLGLVPRLEGCVRFTRIPGKMGFKTGSSEDPDNRLTTDTDHMASGRLTLLTARPGKPGKLGRPGLAVGMDDLTGTRRFHSSYAVAGLPSSILHVQNRLSLGYAFHVFTVPRYVLDGAFGAFEVSPWRDVAVRVEYDTEKWNAGIGVGLGYGLRLRAAALNMESVSIGAGWYHEL